ncbi:TPA: SP_1767 family glycosyltransferase [Streptococcus agalactiae]
MKQIAVLDNLLSINHILTHKSSVVRLGDGEIDIINGKSIPYQDYDQDLATALSLILAQPSNEELLVCLPDIFRNLDRYNQNAQTFWKAHFEHYGDFYDNNCQSPWYGSTFISRPYIDLKDKSKAGAIFASLKAIWKDRDILIIEGLTSRSGVGNDLFDEAKSVERIICPSRNAFDSYDDILRAILKNGDDKLVLLMLGPTAKVLAYDLASRGLQAIDIGHIDSEYEWYQMGATYKVKLDHKHTAEHNWDEDITFTNDETYLSQVIVDLTGQVPAVEQQDEVADIDESDEIEPEAVIFSEEVTSDDVASLTEEEKTSENPHPELSIEEPNGGLISVIVPVYNVQDYLHRCLDSLLKQTYENFELILINDGSTDLSAAILEEYGSKDERIRIYHQKNSGPSTARNFGIQVAEGDYITFVDSDDFVYEEYLNRLHSVLVKNGSDISACNFTSFDENRQAFLFSTTKETFFEKNYTPEAFLREENNPRHNMFLAVVFSPLKLYKRKLFKDLEFPVGKTREDDATVYKLYLRAKQITFINEGPYYYSQRSGSLSRTVMLDDIEMMITNMEERIALMATMGLDITEQKKAYLGRLEKCLADALNANQMNLYKRLKVKVDLVKHFSKEPI